MLLMGTSCGLGCLDTLDTSSLGTLELGGGGLGGEGGDAPVVRVNVRFNTTTFSVSARLTRHTIKETAADAAGANALKKMQLRCNPMQ